MNYKDEIIFEQYFTYRNMNKDMRDFYINLLLHTKDISESEVLLNTRSESKYDLLFLHLMREKINEVRFDGAVANNSENRMVYGNIIKINNKYFVKTNVYRFCDSLSDDNKEYSIIDEFIFKEDRVIRKSRYDRTLSVSDYDSDYYEDEIELYDDLQLSDYLVDKCNQLKLKN